MKIYDPKKILVPVDFSEMTLGVLRTAVDIGEKWAADVAVLHVANESEHVPTIPRPFAAEGTYASYRHQYAEHLPDQSKLLDDAQMKLESRLREMMQRASAGPKVRPMIVWGDPLREILRTAETGNFDLIIMATRGRRGLSRFLLGSVTEQAIRRAPCPVLAVRAKLAETRFAPAAATQESMS